MKAGEELTWYYQIGAHPEDVEPPPVAPSAISGPLSSPLSPLSDVAEMFPALNAPPSAAGSHSTSLPLAQVVERIDVEAEPPSAIIAELFPELNAPPSAAGSHSASLPLAQVVERIDVDAEPPHIFIRREEAFKVLRAQIGQSIGFTASNDHAKEFGMCAICQEPFVSGESVRMQRCLHKFHDTCLMESYHAVIEQDVELYCRRTEISPLVRLPQVLDFKCSVCKQKLNADEETSSNIGVPGRTRMVMQGHAPSWSADQRPVFHQNNYRVPQPEPVFNIFDVDETSVTAEWSEHLYEQLATSSAPSALRPTQNTLSQDCLDLRHSDVSHLRADRADWQYGIQNVTPGPVPMNLQPALLAVAGLDQGPDAPGVETEIAVVSSYTLGSRGSRGSKRRGSSLLRARGGCAPALRGAVTDLNQEADDPGVHNLSVPGSTRGSNAPNLPRAGRSRGRGAGVPRNNQILHEPARTPAVGEEGEQQQSPNFGNAYSASSSDAQHSSSESQHDDHMAPRVRAPQFKPGQAESQAIWYQLCT